MLADEPVNEQREREAVEHDALARGSSTNLLAGVEVPFAQTVSRRREALERIAAESLSLRREIVDQNAALLGTLERMAAESMRRRCDALAQVAGASRTLPSRAEPTGVERPNATGERD